MGAGNIFCGKYVQWPKKIYLSPDQVRELFRQSVFLFSAGVISFEFVSYIRFMQERNYVKIGIAGPVGSGKTALIERLSRRMMNRYSIGVITNDIYTKEDAEFLTQNSLLPAERIIGVETGGCPHTAIREDASMNLEAVEEMAQRFPGIDLIFIESGGDNLSATFSPDLADVTIFVIDVAEGDKIPRKGGPGITRSDLLVINKIDLAPYVNASLEIMDRDARKMRKGSPFVFTNLMSLEGLDTIVEWLQKYALLEEIAEPKLCR